MVRCKRALRTFAWLGDGPTLDSLLEEVFHADASFYISKMGIREINMKALFAVICEQRELTFPSAGRMDSMTVKMAPALIEAADDRVYTHFPEFTRIV
jgi:hypothetical protein